MKNKKQNEINSNEKVISTFYDLINAYYFFRENHINTFIGFVTEAHYKRLSKKK